MNSINSGSILEKIKCDIKEVITNIILDNLVSYGVDLSKIKVEFDKSNSAVIHITLPEIIENKS